MTTVNLHTHTVRCKHAKGYPIDYAKAAAERGIRVLGMTDHTPFPDDRVIMIRMGIAELDDYVREVHEAQAAYPEMKILLGLECEYTFIFSSRNAFKSSTSRCQMAKRQPERSSTIQTNPIRRNAPHTFRRKITQLHG